MVSHRRIGEYSFQYVDYNVTVRAKWVDHNCSHEKTPRYEVHARADRIDGGVCENFSATAEAPVKRGPSLLMKLFGAETGKTDLADLVEKACDRVRAQIDGMYEDIGVDQAREEFQARVEAEAAVESWAEV